MRPHCLGRRRSFHGVALRRVLFGSTGSESLGNVAIHEKSLKWRGGVMSSEWVRVHSLTGVRNTLCDTPDEVGDKFRFLAAPVVLCLFSYGGGGDFPPLCGDTFTY